MILVFVGAGGSAAVDPEQYPTTVGFFNRLPDDITGDGLFGKVREFLQYKKGEEPIDIEKILQNLDKLHDYFQESRNTDKGIAGWIMAEHRINQLVGGGPDLSPILSGMSNLEPQILNLKSKINAQVYRFYAAPPDPEKLSDWIQLFKELAKLDSTIEIFTTNYDLVLETVIKEAKINVETGRVSDGIQMKLDTTCWNHPDTLIDTRGRLTKLHGSVDWQRHNEDIIVGNPNFTGNHENHLILYPGYKEKPKEDPFVSFHEFLGWVAKEAKAAIFIGFAFRDGHINNILQSNLPPRTPTYIINIDKSVPEPEFLMKCEPFGGGLTAETVKACLQHLTSLLQKQSNRDKMAVKRVAQ